ncbi:RICIN domain-containing protein [Streptomyces sp. RKAG290]|uniref:RICIN domain-containing protein n=1 Tax=Streptomyces sp. RKAG290 TaxID=2888348 RepID=UPI0020343CA0|nr:RICIN domain-containing protein [Streptomyces sp. RKAG290]MCM2416381.1 RICIN domain-containing protein [Streptomyces sp. RKAG290]
MVNSNSAKCVDASGAGIANGTPCSSGPVAVRPTSSGSSPHRQRLLHDRQPQLRRQSPSPRRPASSGADGTALDTWTQDGGANQQWQPVAQSDGSYHFVSRASGKCLDVTGASTADGALLEQWTCNGGSNQSFRLDAG